MGTKMKKGLFKGLRYFSNIFDSKEQELQIGYPTDVKHVAHIGWDGASENTPTWMNEFRSAPLTATVTEDVADIPKFPSSEFSLTGEIRGLSVPKPSEQPEKPSRRKKSSEKSLEAADSPKPESSSSKHYRRRQSSTGGSGGESAEGSSRSCRESRDRNRDGAGDNEPPGIPKQSRRRRTKGSSSNSGGVGYTRSRLSAQGSADQRTQEEKVPSAAAASEYREVETSAVMRGSVVG